MNSPEVTLKDFDLYLKQNGMGFEAVVIGGTALNLLGVLSRATKDCDILDPEIPQKIKEASVEFAKEQPDLDTEWFNEGPKLLRKNLRNDWASRIQKVFQGSALTLFTLGRQDLLETKLFAYCDRGIDLGDCMKLNPSKQELVIAFEWVSNQDTNENWNDHVISQFLNLSQELKLGHSKTDF